MMRGTRPLLWAAAIAACGWTAASSQPTGPSAVAPAGPSAEDKAVVARGEVLFDQHCSMCHEPPIEGAPSQADLANYNPDAVTEILKHGAMQQMAKGLSDQDIDAINRFLHSY
jgi:mono/diheme cytochrome c family protein